MKSMPDKNECREILNQMGYIKNLRKVLGHRPIIMTGACVLVIDQEGRILLQKRRDNGLWAYPGQVNHLKNVQ